MWETWHKHHSRCEAVPPLLEINKEDMCKYIRKFLVEVRHKDGKEYTGETLHQFVCGLQQHLRQNGKPGIDFLGI